MAQNKHRIGWIGMGRMGYPMAERLLKAGNDVSIWNRTKSKAEPLAKSGGKVVDKLADLASCDVVFSIVSTRSAFPSTPMFATFAARAFVFTSSTARSPTRTSFPSLTRRESALLRAAFFSFAFIL